MTKKTDLFSNENKKALTQITKQNWPIYFWMTRPQCMSAAEIKAKLDKNVKAVFVLNQVEVNWSSKKKKL